MNDRAQILIRAVDETLGAFDSIKRSLGRLIDTAKRVNGVLTNLGVAVSVAGLRAKVKSALESGDALNEFSQCVGIMVEAPACLIRWCADIGAGHRALWQERHRVNLFCQTYSLLFKQERSWLPASLRRFRLRFYDEGPSLPLHRLTPWNSRPGFSD